MNMHMYPHADSQCYSNLHLQIQSFTYVMYIIMHKGESKCMYLVIHKVHTLAHNHCYEYVQFG